MTLRKTKKTKKRFQTGAQWTNADVTSLVKLYPVHSNQELAAIFGRSELGIMGKARALKLRKNSIGSSQRRQSCYSHPWSIQQEILLQELFPSTPNEEIADILDRSTNAVAIKARRIGLRKMEFWTELEDEQVKTLYTKLSYQQLAERLNRTKGAVQIRIITLGLQCKVENWSDQEVAFLKKAFSQRNLDTIAIHLGRTPGAVARKSALLGLMRNCAGPQSESKTLKALQPHHRANQTTKPHESPTHQTAKPWLFKHIHASKNATTTGITTDIPNVAS